MHELYSHCVGYPVSGCTIPQIAREYLLRYDVGANTFFCGSPGGAVAQIKDDRLRTAIVEHLSGVAGAIAPRLNGLFEDLRNFIRGKTNYRWADAAGAGAVGSKISPGDRAGGVDFHRGGGLRIRRRIGCFVRPGSSIDFTVG